MSNHDDLEAVAEMEHAETLLAALAENDATTAPSPVRDAVLGHAVRAPRQMLEPARPAEVYRGRVEELAELIDSLTSDDWQRHAAPYPWTVHGLVAHLLVIERYTAAQLGLGPAPDGDAMDHLGLGHDVIADELAGDPVDTARRWRETTQLILDHVTGPSFDEKATVQLHQWPFGGGTALVVRGFELWTHTDDIRRATGQEMGAPSPGELRRMSTTSVESLPVAIMIVAPDVPMAPTRVVLTGAGGGTFDLSPEAPGDRTLIAVDVVDYCRVVASRIAADEVDCDIEGDVRLAHALFAAAAIVAM